ncbi:hypothetical protein PAXRUDRAFT_151045, partial [Paxillus rubicundulus Ve08.2h10]
VVLPTPNQACTDASHPTLTEIQQHTLEKFGVWPCLWQLKVVEALSKGDKDIVCTASTGMSKTLSFWLPLLFCPEYIQIVVTPLNMLGKQNAASLVRAGIQAIAINSETSTLSSFTLSIMTKSLN